ncbi:uncharacterized protein LOC110239866 [Exaiptasia diaphana]|uniref:Uncharacterized protein n=1 Tax=Exaiptasia diaphana TaxID=2652724 RepID=A0A913X9S7_EXADI|nr:uncharacterized protein LOC110239866 [Exaiptasia diaphana]
MKNFICILAVRIASNDCRRYSTGNYRMLLKLGMGNEEWRNGEWGMSFVLVSGHTNKSCRGLPVDADHACRAFFFPPLSSGMPNMASSDLVDIDSDSSDSVLPEVSWLTPCAEKDYKVKMEVIEIFSSPETTPIKNTPVITHQAPQG